VTIYSVSWYGIVHFVFEFYRKKTFSVLYTNVAVLCV